jgi:tRNA dimethylallyltransferase
MSSTDAPLYLLAGPTASGKSALALEWAQRTGGLIVNADSMQIYADVPTLTARPTPEDEAVVPHRLYGHLGTQENWSSGEWVRHVTPLIDAALKGGAKLCIVGGTGLYFHSLIKGLAHIPEVTDDIRDEVQRAYESEGEPQFRARLAEFDPAAAARIELNDKQRLIRAYAVWQATGLSLSHWQTDTTPLLAPGTYSLQVLRPDREWLYSRCDQRLTIMLDNGALDEVEALMAKGLKDSWPIMRVLGLRECVALIRGEMTREAALTLGQQKTRNYAKRQMTWFRNQM